MDGCFTLNASDPFVIILLTVCWMLVDGLAVEVAVVVVVVVVATTTVVVVVVVVVDDDDIKSGEVVVVVVVDSNKHCTLLLDGDTVDATKTLCCIGEADADDEHVDDAFEDGRDLSWS